MSDAAEILKRELHAAILESMPAAMAPIQDDIQAAVGVPVGPNGERSKPGEYPRKDTGRLQSEVIVRSAEAGDRVVVTVAVDVPYADKLRRSGRKLGEEIVERRAQDVLDHVADRITNRLS